MSKAFLREDDLTADPSPLPAPAGPRASGAPNYLTPAGAARLRDELARLAEERPRLAAEAAHDFDAKRDLQRRDARARQLQQSLQAAEIVAAPPPPHDTVKFGAHVTVRSVSGEDSRYQIVGADEADALEHRISAQSPLARALLNARVGERVVLVSPAGPQELLITGVSYDA